MDNIPGVPGVGKKTAEALLTHFNSLDEIYANIPTVSTIKVRGAKTLGAKLLEHKDLVYRSQKLTRIATDMPLDVNMDDLRLSQPKLEKLDEFFDDLGIGQGLRLQLRRLS